MKCATDEQLSELSSYDPTDEGKVLRVSKSSFMNYEYCPRQYYWDKVILKDLRMPPSDAMVRGTYVHQGLEDFYETWDGQHHLIPLFPEDEVFETLAQLEQRRLEEWGIEHFPPVEAEKKRIYYNEKYDIVITGMIDGVVRHEDGTLAILELKTGNSNQSKISKTRKELCFYRMVLNDMDGELATRFIYVLPDATDSKLLQSLLSKKSKTVWVGKEAGITLVEKVNKRSVSSFESRFEAFLERIRNHEWEMNWDDWRCPQWCSFNMSCEEEIAGVTFDDTM
jgi:ATP-dependent helicase/DNAse subunit B